MHAHSAGAVTEVQVMEVYFLNCIILQFSCHFKQMGELCNIFKLI